MEFGELREWRLESEDRKRRAYITTRAKAANVWETCRQPLASGYLEIGFRCYESANGSGDPERHPDSEDGCTRTRTNGWCYTKFNV
jgi:hypothetical protein